MKKVLSCVLAVALVVGLFTLGVPVNASAGTAQTMTDELADWSKVYAHSDNWAFYTGAAADFANDTSEIYRATDTAEFVIYKLQNSGNITVNLFFNEVGGSSGSIKNNLRVYVSADGSSYSQVSMCLSTQKCSKRAPKSAAPTQHQK